MATQKNPSQATPPSAAAFAAIEPTPGGQRLYRQLAHQIALAIQAGEFLPGDRLPPERDLAERFHVSRASLREAVIALEIAGIVEVRGGSGIYVLQVEPAAEVPEQGPGPFELLAARRVIEGEVAALAAEAAKSSDIDHIHAALAAMADTQADKAANEAADRLFHLRMAEATGNSALVLAVSTLLEQKGGELWGHMETHFHTPALRQAVLDDHQRVFEALVAKNSRAAKKAMQQHLDHITREFARNWRHPRPS